MAGMTAVVLDARRVGWPSIMLAAADLSLTSPRRLAEAQLAPPPHIDDIVLDEDSILALALQHAVHRNKKEVKAAVLATKASMLSERAAKHDVKLAACAVALQVRNTGIIHRVSATTRRTKPGIAVPKPHVLRAIVGPLGTGRLSEFQRRNMTYEVGGDRHSYAWMQHAFLADLALYAAMNPAEGVE